MKIKAQNTMEIITAVAVVAVIAIAVFMFTNERNANLAKLTKVKANTEQTETIKVNESSSLTKSPYAKKINAETAGSMGNIVKNIDKTSLMKKLSSKTAEKITGFQSEDGKDIIDLANELIDELDLSFVKIERNKSVEDISAELVNVSFIAKEKLKGAENATYNTFLSVLGNIIKE